MRKVVLTLACLAAVMTMAGELRDSRHARRAKLSATLRRAVAEEPQPTQRVIAFVKMAEGGEAAITEHGGTILLRKGRLCIVDLPLEELEALTGNDDIERVEASDNTMLLTDSMAHHLDAWPVYEGNGLPQAYTGKGVMLGIMDLGFDLTHPNFYDARQERYRICSLWDMLGKDPQQTQMPVGCSYEGREALLALGCTYDGRDQTHGTYTLGIAAGSGCGTKYRGMAPEADICMVANVVSNNASLIDSIDYYRYTNATNALGFNYIFEQAARLGEPCVISFSEGGGESFREDHMLYYEMLDSLTGPGRILVAAAGNAGHQACWLRKPAGRASAGTFATSGGNTLYFTLKSMDDFLMRLVFYDIEKNDTLLLDTRQVVASADSLWSDTIAVAQQEYAIEVEAFRSYVDHRDLCYDVYVSSEKAIGTSVPLSVEVLGREADVTLWHGNARLRANALNPLLADAECSHSIHSPSAAPSVISVGATNYCDSIRNVDGEWKKYWESPRGTRAPFSSVGPTADGRVKPDVMAPGNNIVSSYSSFFIEAHGDSPDLLYDVARYEWNGRRYAWTASAGTSSSCPAVAGSIALWLEACPDLSPQDVLRVFSHTCSHPDETLSYPNNEYGYGQIDVYRGLRYLMDTSSITGIKKDAPIRMRLSSRDGRITLRMPSGNDKELVIRLYSLSGQLLGEQKAGPSERFVSVPAPRGISIVSIGF